MPSRARRAPPRLVSFVLWSCCVLLGMVGCGAHEAREAKSPPARAESAPAAPLHDGPLTDYVPAPSLAWLLAAEPSRIAAQPGVLEALGPLVDEAAFGRFVDHSGFDLRKTHHAVIAGFELGTLYLVDETDPAVERSFRERLLAEKVARSPHPALTRIHGVVGTTPEALLRAEDRLVAWSVGDLTLVRLVEGYLTGRFRRTPSALRGAALGPHADFAADAPLRFWAPGPFELLGAFGPPESLPDVTATLAALEPFQPAVCACRGPDLAGPAVRIYVSFAGPWAPGDVTTTPLERAWRALAESPTGRLLGLDAPLRAPEFSVTELADGARLDLRVEFPLRPLARNLRAVLTGSLEEVLSAPRAGAAGAGAP